MNMMTTENLSIVLAPSLMSSSYTDPASCLAGAKLEQAVVERLIVDFNLIFNNHTDSAAITSIDGGPPASPIRVNQTKVVGSFFQFFLDWLMVHSLLLHTSLHLCE
ncbi:unnamed protein product [Protopolystoma xenopodis]|uniref:Rho-GAP domain-containing protein n=1 Tax=Protopolystoma xenopodis TaxID=117903 RepID=A0A3S5CTF5_9PLAT|nr:unnamed protein product [Protopolystoma xenopodis]